MTHTYETHSERLDWDDVSDIFEPFCVSSSRAEMRWFEKAWKGFIETHNTSYSNEAERHLVLVKAVTVGMMFNRFAEIAWEEITHAEATLYDLKDRQETFDMIRIGNMASRDSLPGWAEEDELFVHAMRNLVRQHTPEVYQILLKTFGNPPELFASLWLSKDPEIEVGQYPDMQSLLLDDHVFEPGRLSAYEYVTEGMRI